MKNLPIVLSSLALIGVIILFATNKTSKGPSATSGTSASSSPAGGPGRIAYIDIDTLEANFTYLKNKKEEFTHRQESMKAELQNSAAQMQRDIADIQRRAKAGTLTEAEYAGAEKRIGQMQQSLQAREAALTDQLLREQDEFNRDLQKRLDAYLEEYNKDKHFDYVLSYSREGHILYKNPSLDITRDVIKGMNQSNPADTTKKK